MKSFMSAVAAAGLLAAVAMAQTSHLNYDILDLGVVGGTPGQPYVIANNGLIAGAADTASSQSHAAVWFIGMKFDLGVPGLGGPNSAAYGINPVGQVVGGAETTVPNSEDFCGFNAFGLAPSSTSCLPFLWQKGSMA